jgi:signal transduction histidine kinase
MPQFHSLFVRIAAAFACLAFITTTPARAQVTTPVPTSIQAATNPPLISIRQFLTNAPGWGESNRVRVRGTVTHSISDRTYFIQQDGAGTYVFHKPSPPFAVGDEVEVIGFPSLGGFAPTLQRCEASKLGSGPLPQPHQVSFNEARMGRGHMQLVRIHGRLAAHRLRGGQTLVLTAGGETNAFTVELEAVENLAPLNALRSGSLLEVTGVCSVRRDSSKRPSAFTVYVRSPADVVMLKPPPWWTLERTWRVLGFGALGLIFALIWVLSLRAQVRQQTAQIRKMNDELELRVAQRTAELSAANKELESFSYSVSHDLRAPVRHIGGFASLLLQKPALADDPPVRKALQQIISSAGQMGRLIDALLAFARMARTPLIARHIALTPLVEEAVLQLQPDIGERNIEWQRASLPEVHGDASMLRLVWQNLLANAVKYTRHRPIAVIEVGCTASEKEWTFFVRDNGAGFDMKYASQLFGVFHRLHRDDEFEGTGIGLANVRRTIERHGGRVWAEAVVDEGATFYFTLPR